MAHRCRRIQCISYYQWVISLTMAPPPPVHHLSFIIPPARSSRDLCNSKRQQRVHFTLHPPILTISLLRSPPPIFSSHPGPRILDPTPSRRCPPQAVALLVVQADLQRLHLIPNRLTTRIEAPVPFLKTSILTTQVRFHCHRRLLRSIILYLLIPYHYHLFVIHSACLPCTILPIWFR